MGEHVRAGNLDMWVERRGRGPDVLLIAGLGDPAEAWQFQLDGLADRYRLTAYDNRGMGRTPLPAEPFSVATMADDAAALLRALDVPAAHVTGFSGGSVIAQELVLRHPGLVRSLVLASTWARPDAYFRAAAKFWRWLPEAAPSERPAARARRDRRYPLRQRPVAYTRGASGDRRQLSPPRRTGDRGAQRRRCLLRRSGFRGASRRRP
jgi:pimeloyl-ACP methyl ester carboxylesterase